MIGNSGGDSSNACHSSSGYRVGLSGSLLNDGTDSNVLDMQLSKNGDGTEVAYRSTLCNPISG